MKKIIGILLFLVAFVFSADVKPFYFENVPNDSASQQTEFDYMLKYKLFGHDYLKMGTRVRIPDKSGWNGSSIIVSAEDQLELGGPILSPSPIKMGNECKTLSGPIVAEALITGNDNNKSLFSGTICLADTNVSNEARKGITRGEGILTNKCDSLPEPPVNLIIPTIPWPETMTHEDIVINANGSEDGSIVYIDVPEGDSKEPYDIYINTIDANKSVNKDGAKIYFRMQDGGRLVRVFVHNLLIGNHTTIQTVYKTEDGEEFQTQSQYRGNVLFYSDNDITFTNTDNVPIQGTFISLKKIELACNLDFAGQLLANELKIGNDFKGENFRFVPFDTPIVDIDPELNKNGGLKENDSTVVIPIKLSDTATVDVYFSYCFELNETVDSSDFNLEGLKFPVCRKDTASVVIKTGEKWPADPIQVNVKKDTLIELSDTLVVRIKIESGAVLPNNKTDGVLKIAIIDADYKNQAPELNKDQTIDPYEEEQLIPPGSGVIGKIDVTDERPNDLIFELTDSSGLFVIDNKGTITTAHVFDYETEDTVYVVQVKVTDKEGLADSANYEIKIKNKDEDIKAIVEINPVYEGPADSIVGGIVGIVTGKDGDSTKVSYKLTDLTGSFGINDSTGIITILKELDYEKQNKYPVTVSMTSTDGSKKDTTFTIIVLNVNEPVHVKDTTFTVPENKKDTIIGKVNAWDEDNDQIYYSISNNTDYSIDDNGNIIVKTPFDYEVTKADTITVYVEDGNNMKDSAKVIINVNNINEGITATSKIEEVKENIDIGTIVGVITAKDSDNVDVTYSIDKPYFKIDPVTGVITTNTIMDYEVQNEYSVVVTVESKDSSKKVIPLTIKIIDVNEQPELKESVLKIDENTTGNAGSIKVIDDDKNPDFLKNELSIIDGDTSKFKIDGNNIIVKTPLDYEQDSVYNIKVKVQDKTVPTLVDTMTYTIKVNNVPEKPEVKDITTDVNENSTGIIDTLKATDPDGDKLKYEVIDNKNIKVDTNGIISIVTPFDYETDSIIIAHVVVTDPSGLTDTATISLKINDVNEPHTVSDETITIPEDTTKTFKSYPVDTVKVTDPDLNPKHKFELIDTTNTFKIDSNGVISVIKPLDYENVKEYNVKVIVSDSLYADTATIKIKVENIDENSNVKIVHVDTRDSVYTETDKPIYTNDKDIEITYKTDDKHKDTTITGLKEGENKIEICDIGEGKDTKACDTVTVWYSNKTPIITVATIDKNKSNVNNITIIDEPDGNQYVNSKTPEIKVTVKDPTNAKKDTTFNIYVDLKTVDVPVKSLTNKTIEPIDIALTPDAKHEVIGKDSVKVTYYDPITKATVSYVTNSEGKRINDEFTVSYVEKINDQDVTISYTTDSYVEVKSNYSISYSVPQGKDTITVSYQVDSDGKIQKTNGNVGYTISYSYTNEYGNTGTSEIQVVLDDVPPKVEIYKLIAGKDTLYPSEGKNWTEYVASSSIIVFWTVDGKDQDTLTLQGLKAEKINPIVRCYQDKANNQTCDTVNVYAKGAKEIEIKIAHPVTEIDKDRVDSFYNEGGKYNPKKPIQIIAQDASEDKLPEPVGVGIKIGLALPILNQNGGMPTADDIVQTIDGVTGIVIDGNGNVVTDAIAEIRDNSTKIISVDKYIENYCTDQYKEEVRKNGIEKVPFYDMKYSMHVWIFNNNAEYVNDFNFEYIVDENQKVDASGMLNLMVDWLADTDGCVKAANKHCLQTGAFLTKLDAKSISTAKCTLNADTKKGTKIKKTEYDLTSFGYKRPTKK